jgi:hypothetical protein
MTAPRQRWRRPVGEPWFPHDQIDEGGCPFTHESPFTELYHHDHAVVS